MTLDPWMQGSVAMVRTVGGAKGWTFCPSQIIWDYESVLATDQRLILNQNIGNVTRGMCIKKSKKKTKKC